jgi:hypothetical protein
LVLLVVNESASKLRTIMLSSFIYTAGMSAKAPFALVLFPLIICFILLGIKNVALKRRFLYALWFTVPGLLVGACWMLHTYSLTGNFVDVPVAAVWSDNSPESHAYFLAAWPTFRSNLELLLTPFVAPFIGNQQPFGGRVGLAFLFFPLFFFQFKHLSEARKDYANWLLRFSLFYFIAIGLFVVRTRYHCFVWEIWSTLSAVGFSLYTMNAKGRVRSLACWFYCALVGLSCLDVIHTALIWEPVTQPHWLPHFDGF